MTSKSRMTRVHRQRPLRHEGGWVLLVFAVFAVVLAAGAYRLMPAWVFQGQRQKEELLISRGLEYRRAIQLFVRKNGRYPATLEELEKTNEIRFLRQRYPDPMAETSEEGDEEGGGEWRLIHVGPGGVIIDALHPPGTVSTAGEASKESEQKEPGPMSGLNAGQRPTPPQAVVSSGIAGVASLNEGESIKKWNGYDHYNEWEFMFVLNTDAIAMKKVASLNPQQAQQPTNQPDQPARPNQPQPSVPFNPLRPFQPGVNPPPGNVPPGTVQPQPPPSGIQMPGGRGTRPF